MIYFVVFGNADFRIGKRPADSSQAASLRRIDGDATGRFGQAVALENMDIRGQKEFGNFPAERGSAGNEETQASPQALFQLGKHQPLRQGCGDAQ